MMADLLYLDDLAIGRCFGSATMIVDESEMTSYAQLFDPQPFHLDREAARERHNQALTQQEATAILARYQELWNRAALAELLDGFTDDITVEFADLPTIKGKRELDRIIPARLARQKHYRLTKTLRFV